MSSPPSNSDGGTPASSAFSLLHLEVQRWVWKKGWSELKEIQEVAIAPVLAGERDVILSASTASGKTEAAFLPICSRLVEPAGTPGVRAVYVGPLKALINDQFERLDALCEGLGITVHRWHGDVSQSAKTRLLKAPSGILLITPESLEALLLRQGPALAAVFSALSYVVVDELHAFIGTERGCQLQSLLHRLELVLRRSVPRIGLSATLGDMRLAADFLRPGGGESVVLASPGGEGGELLVQLRGYRTRAPRPDRIQASQSSEAAGKESDDTPEDVRDIGAHLFRTLRGSHNLVFANSRANVELYADLLRRLCEEARLPNEFFPHHGNLSKELREDAEAALKGKQRPVTLVCTTTLEMGIDVGDVQSVAQVGVPPSVASLRQRLGRSGRRSNSSVLRLYIQEHELTESSSLPDALRVRFMQSLAMVELLLQGWCEPPAAGAYHFSTLVQQVLSLIAQHGGVQAAEAWSALCVRGPFAQVSREAFVRFLRGLGEEEVLTQSSDGTLLLGRVGERLVNHYSFYAAFASAEEYRLVARERTLGTMPIEQPLVEGSYLIFGGRRWRILSVRQEEKVVELEAAPAGRVPMFEATGVGNVHDRVREEMRRLYAASDVPRYLDARAQELLAEGRATFERCGLMDRCIATIGRHVYVFPWKGDAVLHTLALQLRETQLKPEVQGPMLAVGGPQFDVEEALRSLVPKGPAQPHELVRQVANLVTQKHDVFVPSELLGLDFAARYLDPRGAWEAAQALSLRAPGGSIPNAP